MSLNMSKGLVLWESMAGLRDSAVWSSARSLSSCSHRAQLTPVNHVPPLDSGDKSDLVTRSKATYKEPGSPKTSINAG